MWDMPWTTSQTMVARRINEELLKRGQGDLKVSFSIPMNWVGAFDILTNIRLQDPFGLGTGDDGERGRYYYIESITYDWMGGKLDIIAVDLQYLLRQCIILGDCDTLPLTWTAASEEQRMFGYLCGCALGTDGEFPDGEHCKMLCSCL